MSTQPIGEFERLSLGLVFGGPVSLWLPLAKLVRVRIDPDPVISEESLSHAESQAYLAGRRFNVAGIATLLCLTAAVVILPAQTVRIGPFISYGFEVINGWILSTGLPWWIAEPFASLATLLFAAVIGLLNAAVFGLLPLVFLRRSAEAAAPAVSIVLADGDHLTDGTIAGHPRVVLAAERLLGGAKRR